MALILEIRDPRGVPAWHRLDRLPLTVGRAVSNDIIVDDPYADPVHARIEADATGAPVIVDAGSLNGVYADGARVNGSTALVPGAELRVGRTVLRVRATDEALPPAVADLPPPRPSVATVAERRATRMLHVPRAQAAIVAVMAAVAGLSTWLGNTERSSGTSIFGVVLAALLAAALWAAVWAAAARGTDRRFHFLAHLSVVSLALIALTVYSGVNEWLSFLLPDASLVPILYLFGGLAILAALVASHLAVPGLLTRRARWRAGLIAAGTVLALTAVGALLSDEEFSDVPSFEKQLKPLPAAMVPTSTVDDFLGVMREMKTRADEAAASP